MERAGAYNFADALDASLLLSFACAPKSVPRSHKVYKTTHVNSIQIHVSDDPVLALHVLSVDRKCEIFCHDPVSINNLNARSLEISCERAKRVISIKLGAV